jgi:hypothetical protein
MATENLLIENRLRKCIQTIEAESHVNRIESYKDARRRGNAQQRPPRIKRARPWTVSSSRQRTVSPEGATISIAQIFEDAVSAGASLTSLNTAGTGRLEARFVLVSQ